MDRVHLLSTAIVMSSSSVEAPTDEAGSRAVEVEGGDGAGEPATLRKLKTRKRLKKKRRSVCVLCLGEL